MQSSRIWNADNGIYMCTATDSYGQWAKPVNIRPGVGWIDVLQSLTWLISHRGMRQE